MPWAIFTRQFNFDHRPQRAVCQTVRPKPEPQQFATPLIKAAVDAGAAHRVRSPTAAQKRTLQSKPA